MVTTARVLLLLGLLWHAARPGVWHSEALMAEDGPLSVVRTIAVRIEPAEVDFTLAKASRDYGLKGDWSIDRMPAAALAAFNAGQFMGAAPWGWLVRDGVELQPPGVGTLAMSFVVVDDGQVSLVTPDELPGVRARARQAFQSYPALLVGDAQLPWEIQAPGRGVDLNHRDSRLALGQLKDGSLVVVLTRFDGLGRVGETMPWGPTVPEMAGFMKSLGCRRAMLLDGGLSSQLAVRNVDGSLATWTNWRTVPLGLVISPKSR